MHLECKVRTILELGDLPAAIVVGEVLCFHVHEEFVKDGIIDVRKLKPLGRAGENLYVRFSDFFEMDMPA